MEKNETGKDLVKIIFPSGKNRYLILTGKTGCPSADYRCRDGGVIVPDDIHRPADR